MELSFEGLGGKYGEELKVAGEISREEKKTIVTEECIYYIKTKHFDLLKVTKDSQEGVTDRDNDDQVHHDG